MFYLFLVLSFSARFLVDILSFSRCLAYIAAGASLEALLGSYLSGVRSQLGLPDSARILFGDFPDRTPDRQT